MVGEEDQTEPVRGVVGCGDSEHFRAKLREHLDLERRLLQYDAADRTNHIHPMPRLISGVIGRMEIGA